LVLISLIKKFRKNSGKFKYFFLIDLYKFVQNKIINYKVDHFHLFILIYYYKK